MASLISFSQTRTSKTIIGLGLFVAILPFLGFPDSWDKFFYLAAGLAIAYLSFSSSGAELFKFKINRPGQTQVFVENKDMISRDSQEPDNG